MVFVGSVRWGVFSGLEPATTRQKTSLVAAISRRWHLYGLPVSCDGCIYYFTMKVKGWQIVKCRTGYCGESAECEWVGLSLRYKQVPVDILYFENEPNIKGIS